MNDLSDEDLETCFECLEEKIDAMKRDREERIRKAISSHEIQLLVREFETLHHMQIVVREHYWEWNGDLHD